ncbi:MAG: DUF2461 domain-containing protein [Bryobacteraceae bacterium]
MATRFPGFPEVGVQFLRGLSRHNRREWFQPRKEIFERDVKKPMEALVEALNADFARYAPDYITDPNKAVYRIYRDTRFSHDKTPYKTHIAASFWRRGFQKHVSAGYYFSVSPKEIEVAGGIYMPGPEQLLAIRRKLASDHEAFRKLLKARVLRSTMGDLQGDSLSRVPKGFPADHAAADLIRRKNWIFYVLLDGKLSTSPKLLDEVTRRFRALAPCVEYLNQALAGGRAAAAGMML